MSFTRGEIREIDPPNTEGLVHVSFGAPPPGQEPNDVASTPRAACATARSSSVLATWTGWSLKSKSMYVLCASAYVYDLYIYMYDRYFVLNYPPAALKNDLETTNDAPTPYPALNPIHNGSHVSSDFGRYCNLYEPMST